MKLHELSSMYERGIITLTELESRLIEELTVENVVEIEELPEYVQIGLRNRIDRCPLDEHGWAKMRYLSANMTKKEMDRRNELFRQGVSIYRKHKG